MGTVLVAGGAGMLGSEVTRLLAERGARVRVLARRAAAKQLPLGVEWARGDVVTGEGLRQALAGVTTVVHAATTPSMAGSRPGPTADIAGTHQLLDASAEAGVEHFLYVSIVGMEGVNFGYYHRKLAAEAMVAAGKVPWSILRITQFHPLLDLFLGLLAGRRRPLLLPAGVLIQPIDPGDAAAELVAALGGGPGGRLPDVGGPEVRESHDLAHAWLAARGERRPILPVPLLGRTGRELRAGVLTCPDRRFGTVTWEQWLAARQARTYRR